MKTKFEEFLDLPALDELLPEIEDKEVIEEHSSNREKYNTLKEKLRDVGDLNEKDLNSLKTMAENAHKNLIDLGMNVPPGQSESFLSVSHSYLSLAADIEKEKISNNFKYEKLRLDRQKMELELAKLELQRKKIDGDKKDNVIDMNSDEPSEFIGTRNDLINFLKGVK